MAYADLALVITAAGASVVAIVASLLLVIQFGNPDDKNQALFPKFIVIAGLYLAFAVVMLLPFDIGCVQARLYAAASIRADVVWQILMVAVFFMLTFGLPFAIFFYESDSDPFASSAFASQFKSALTYASMVLILACGLVASLYPFLATAEIPSKIISKNFSRALRDRPIYPSQFKYDVQSYVFEMPVTLLVFAFSVISFLGWFAFAVVSPIGLVTLPMDLINEYLTRPTPISTAVYVRKKLEIAKHVNELLAQADDLVQLNSDLDKVKSKGFAKSSRRALNKLEVQTYSFKCALRHLKESYELRGGNPFWYFSKLLCGVFGAFISVLWILQLILLLIPSVPFATWLDDSMLRLRESTGFPFAGAVIFGIMNLYLLCACIKGVFSLGMRCPSAFRIYPMEFGNTMMNAFLANVWIILLCSVPLAQFAANTFPLYAHESEAGLLFGTHFRHLRFFRYFYANNAFVVLMLVLASLSLLVNLIWPKDRAKLVHRMIMQRVAQVN